MRACRIKAFEGGDYGGLIGDVEGEALGGVAGGPERCHGFGDALFIGAIDQHARSGAGETLGHGAAKATRRAGDQGGFAIKAEGIGGHTGFLSAFRVGGKG